MKTYAGIDLHSSNNFIGIIDEHDKRLVSKRLPNNLDEILSVLKPFKHTLKGVVVESTYNWYWLVDGLQEHGYNLYLANPAAIQQYNGLKYTDDKWDSFWLAHLLRLNILRVGYIYPKEQRPIRDLLRRRIMYVRQRTQHILSLQSMITRNRALNFPGSSIKRFREEFADKLFDSPYLVFTAKRNIQAIQFLSKIVNEIEIEIKAHAKLKKEFIKLLTIPGIGDILGLTIMMEVGDINRFPKVGNYSSYCRCVESKRISNKKKKGQNNKKNGNRYLAWAYVEAANYAIRYCPNAQKFFQRKMAKKNRTLAVKALGNKLTKASYYIMRDQVSYDPKKLFR
ncbi:MAG: IS110 family transposase [Bacteroidetes bacterium]|nr:IS110 family transposase [Bacteroidota bacterium]